MKDVTSDWQISDQPSTRTNRRTLNGVEIITVMFLRDPVARIKSAYRFEREQNADTWGAELAKKHDLEGYVHARLARPGDRQCRNFQTHRLASLIPGEAPELERALTGLATLSTVGLVENFDASMARLADKIQPAYPDFTWNSVRANTTENKSGADAALNALLITQNTSDLAVLEAARTMLNAS